MVLLKKRNQKMHNQAKKLEELTRPSIKKSNKSTKFISITSGKGGVGKSTISSNLAYTLSKKDYKVAIFDADIGLANLDIMFDVRCPKNILHVLKGESTLRDIIVPINENLVLIPGESGDEILKYSDQFLYERFFEESSILDDLDYFIIDTGAGIGGHTQLFLEASDEVIVVTVPDPAAITDAYATMKLISKIKNKVFLILNMSKSEKEANFIYEKIVAIAKKNISEHFKIEHLGTLLRASSISSSVKHRKLFAKENPYSNETSMLDSIVLKITSGMEQNLLKEEKNTFSEFFKKIINKF